MIPDHLPTLAVGSHDRGSGAMCVMNAISYMNGDANITDFPDCVDPYLARVAQILNDQICEHTSLKMTHTSGHLDAKRTLCGSCAHLVWLFGAQLMGTAEPWRDLVVGVRRHAQWAAYRDMLYRQLLGSRLLRSSEERQAARAVGNLLMRPTDVSLSLHVAEILNLIRPASTSQVADALQRVADLARLTSVDERWPHLSYPPNSLEDASVQAAYASLLLSTPRRGEFSPWRKSGELHGAGLAKWAEHQLEEWVVRVGYAPEPLTLTAPVVERLERDAGLIRV